MTENVADRKPQVKPGAWAGYAAFAVGFLYTLISLYWAVGGTQLLDTIGGRLAELARARDNTLLTFVWLTVALKLVAALLGLALTMQWGQRLPRWLLILLAWGATLVLVLYGGYLVIGQLAVQLGLINASASIDWKALHWHLFLWDPWFLLWGILLGITTWYFIRRTKNDWS